MGYQELSKKELVERARAVADSAFDRGGDPRISRYTAAGASFTQYRARMLANKLEARTDIK